MTEFSNVFIHFITNCITGVIPILEDKVGKSLFNRVEECYGNALKKWADGNEIRERLASKKYLSISQLRDLYTATKWKSDAIALKRLTYLWAEELQNDKECSLYIEENQDITNNEVPVIYQNYASNTISQCIHRGRYDHNEVDVYIRRYCSLEQEHIDFLDYLFEHSEKLTLADFVVGIQNTSSNKFILYSSAQTGKTTELKQLCWELQQSGIFLPLLFEVRLNTHLKREQLPNVQYVEGKEIVVVIDALDEVNGIVYNDLLKEIEGYSFDHPKTKIVLSCRSNYRYENQLNQFTKLYLNELSTNDIKTHIVNTISGNNRLYNILVNKQLIDFAKNPFFLNILINAYDSNKQLPNNKAEIYRLFIESSYKNKGINNLRQFDESLHLLERIALALSLMNKQTLNEEEILECLNNKTNLEECLRYDIIQCENGLYSLKHSAFREWLVANYLQRKGIEKAKKLATHPNDQIKQEWYNIIILWLSMFNRESHQEISEVLEWLSEARLELIVHIDKGLLDEDKRNVVFEKILSKYKQLGIRMSIITTRDYTNLLSFGQSENTVKFIAKEINSTTSDTPYYADLMCLCYFMDWYKLTEQTQIHLYEVLEQKVKDALTNMDANDLTFIFLDNRFFEQKKYVERLFEIVKESNYYVAILAMTKLIGKVDKVDEYLDYILDKEQYVRDQQDGNSTLSVSRTPIYDALTKVETVDGVKKVLSHQFPYIKYGFEQKEYLKMMESIINKISDLIIKGNIELIEEIKSFYVSTFKDYDYHFDRDNIHQDLIKSLRNCFQKTGLNVIERKEFIENVPLLFETNNTESILKAFSTTALWITTDDVKFEFEKFASENQQDQIKALWYCKIPYREVSEYANVLYNEKYVQTLPETKWNEKQHTDFNEFENYNIFKQRVLTIVAELKNITSQSSLKDYLWKQDNTRNQYALLFVSRYIDNNDIFTIIEKVINHQEYYESFFVAEVVGMILSSHLKYFVTDNAKERCIAYAKRCIINVCNGEQKTSLFEKALRLMVNGYFEIDNDCLLKLLDYGDFFVYIKDEDDKRYYLIDYIKKQLIDYDILDSLVIKSFQANFYNENKQLLSIFATYIIENEIEEGYSLALKYALNGDIDVLVLIIKKKIELDEVKRGINELNPSYKLTCYHLFIQSKIELKWVRQQLESEYLIYNGYDKKRAIVMLMNLGSVDALNYLVSHIELIEKCNDLYFNFDSPEAINALCYLIKYEYVNKSFDRTFILDSILKSLENIALYEEDSFNEVKTQLNLLIKEGEQFKYLNRFVNALENKYLTSQSEEMSIKVALEMIDTELKDGHSLYAHQIAENDEYPSLYVSYSWKGHSYHIVDHLEYVLKTNGIICKRDKINCNYTDNIKEFMDAIRSAKRIIVVFSKEYLRSEYCMYELSGIMQNDNFKKRILPIKMESDIKDDHFYVELIKHWKNIKDKQEMIVSEINAIDPNKAKPEILKLESINGIYDILDVVKEYIDSINTDSLDNLSETNFEPIIKILQTDIKTDII